MKKYLKKLITVIAVLGCISLSVISSAEERKDEWKDPQYNFGKINRVLVKLNYNTIHDISELDKIKINSLITSKWSGQKKGYCLCRICSLRI